MLQICKNNKQNENVDSKIHYGCGNHQAGFLADATDVNMVHPHVTNSRPPNFYRVQKGIHEKIKHKRSKSKPTKDWQSRFTLFKCIFAFLWEHRYLSFPLISYAIMIQKAAHADIVTDQLFPITIISCYNVLFYML